MLSNYGKCYSAITSYLINNSKSLLNGNSYIQVLPRHCCYSSSSNIVVSSIPHTPVLGTLHTNTFSFGGTKTSTRFLNYNGAKRYISLGHVNTRYREVKVNPSSKVRVTVKRKKDGVTNSLGIDESEWKTVYRFKYIRVAQVIQKMKLYQTGFTCCFALPGSLGCFMYGAVPAEAVGFMLVSSTLATGMLYIMGRFCSRLIGIIYVSNTDDRLVRIAHLNFWGKREDQMFSKTDFTPFSELPDNVSDVYVNVRFYSEPDTKLHLCVRYGTIYSKVEFEEIFGTHTGVEISELGNKQSKEQ